MVKTTNFFNDVKRFFHYIQKYLSDKNESKIFDYFKRIYREMKR